MSEEVPHSSIAETCNNSKSRQISPAKHWFFTWNTYPITAREVLSSNRSNVKTIVCQTEIAPTTGTKHIQGYIEFANKVRPMTLFPSGIHWEKCKSPEKARAYCSKEESFDKDGWRLEYPEPPEPLEIMTLDEVNAKPWMKEIHDLIATKPHKRTIYWYWEPVGGVGKTDFVKFIAHTYKEKVIVCRASKSADILTCVTERGKMYLFDFPREAELTFSPWLALEQVKDGFVSDGKLKKETRNLVFNRPHVVCFANWPPPEAASRALSGDKLKVIEIV